jgi:hypothetical protein
LLFHTVFKNNHTHHSNTRINIPSPAAGVFQKNDLHRNTFINVTAPRSSTLPDTRKKGGCQYELRSTLGTPPPLCSHVQVSVVDEVVLTHNNRKAAAKTSGDEHDRQQQQQQA